MYLIMGGQAGEQGPQPGARSHPSLKGCPVGKNIGEYLACRALMGELSPESVATIRAVLATWERHAGDDPASWTAELVATWVHDPTIRASTAKSRLTKLRPYVRWLIAEDLLEGDPTTRIGRIRIPDGEPRDLEHDEIRRLVDIAPDQRGRLIVVWLAQLGIRAGSMARARIEDVDVRRRELRVRGKGGRGEVTYSVAITEEAWNEYVAWLATTGRNSGPVVDSYQRPGHHLTAKAISDLVAGWMAEAGLKQFPYDGRSTHSLRHSCAQHMVDAGADVRDVQHALGHRDLRTAEIYLRRRRMDRLRAAMEGRRYAA